MIASWRSVSDVVTGDMSLRPSVNRAWNRGLGLGRSFYFAGPANGAGLLFCETNAAAEGLPGLGRSANP